MSEDDLLQYQQRPDRQQHRERLVVLLQRRLEALAALAFTSVAANRGRELGQPFGHFGKFDPHLFTGDLASLGCFGEAATGANQQRLDAWHGRLHRLGDLVVGERVDLAQQQRRALRLGQLAHVGHQLSQVFALAYFILGRAAVVGNVVVEVIDADCSLAAEVVERAVAGNPVEPRLDVDRALIGHHRAVGGGEAFLRYVLSVLLRGQHVAREAEDPCVVAADQRLIGRLVTAARQRDQFLVRLETQKGARGAQSYKVGLCDC